MDSPADWKTESVGRVLIDLPTRRPRYWGSEFDGATVRQMQRPLTPSQFWARVHAVRDEYAQQKHRKESTRLANYVRPHGLNAALVIGYANDGSSNSSEMWRWVHLDEQHAFEFVQTLDLGKLPPSAQRFQSVLESALSALSRISPLAEGEIPNAEGLSIEGAVVSGETGSNARATLIVEVAHGVLLSISYRENNDPGERYSGFEALNRLVNRAQLDLRFPNQPTATRELKVLRRQERTLSGLRGQEFITRTTLNNGQIYYAMQFLIKGGRGLLEPTVSIQFTTSDTPRESDGLSYAVLPAEPVLIALWDAVLDSFKVRPGALPAGQALHAIN